MERKSMSRTYQENLLINLVEQVNDISTQPDVVAASKKILVSMRYFMTNFVMDDDIVDETSILVDKIMARLNMGASVSMDASKACFVKAND